MRNSLLLIVLSLLCVLPARSQTPPAAAHDLAADTWVATDGLGRAVPTGEEVGPPRPHRAVGMFYFLTAEHGGDGPYDNTKILKVHPEAIADIHNPAWGPLKVHPEAIADIHNPMP